MKRITLLIALLAVLTPGARADNAADARKILDKVAAVVAGKNGVEATFLLKGEKINAKGTIAVKGNKFTANTTEATVWYDGTTQWTYVKKTDEVNISTPSKEQQAQMNPLTFINLYKSGYKLSVSTKNGTSEVRMQAVSSSSAIQEIYVVVNATTYVPVQVRMRRKSAWMTINISDFTTLKKGDGIFVFNKKDYPDAEIVDLR
ncbi:MAG: cell envelope biogenesis protein LolA [Prevotella sp.]|nr:cell envelope biogenesis protein LolA [Prevotella sp.]